jgi:hypothetical protein
MIPMIAGYALGSRAAARANAMGVVADHVFAPTTNDLIDLEERMDRLTLVLEALWNLLRENGYTDEQLAEHIRQLDTSDATLDGRRVSQPTVCRSCDSKVPAGLARCQFCGTETGTTPGPFEKV